MDPIDYLNGGPEHFRRSSSDWKVNHHHHLATCASLNITSSTTLRILCLTHRPPPRNNRTIPSKSLFSYQMLYSMSISSNYVRTIQSVGDEKFRSPTSHSLPCKLDMIICKALYWSINDQPVNTAFYLHYTPIGIDEALPTFDYVLRELSLNDHTRESIPSISATRRVQPILSHAIYRKESGNVMNMK